jgi:hypothetical protein
MKRSLNMVGGALLAAGVLAAGAQAQPAPKAARAPSAPCFFISQWRGWKAPNPHTLYLGVNMHDVYEVDLSGDAATLQDPDARLISVSRGSDSVCAAIDLQLTVAEPYGISEPLIARSLVKLTPEQVAAIPPKYRPY